MSVRFAFGIILLLITVLSPWVVEQWLLAQTEREQILNKPIVASVPELGLRVGKLPQKRSFRAVSEQVSGVRTAKRVKTRSITTGARGFRLRSIPSQRDLFTDPLVARPIDQDMRRFGMRLGDQAFARIFKNEGELELWIKPASKDRFSLLKTYRLSVPLRRLGPKENQRDLRFPEGYYEIAPSQLSGGSSPIIELGFPNLLDRSVGRSGSAVSLGSDDSRCSASLGEHEMLELFTIISAALKNGQRPMVLHSFPFRMEDVVMDAQIAKNQRYDGFWANLKQGYDYFELLKRPPYAQVENGAYYIR